MTDVNIGATKHDWYVWDMELGLGAHLLPCVPATAGVDVQDGSALEGKLGKIPSFISARGAHGIKDWQKKEILPAELALWRKDPRLNLCVRTGISGVYAIDVDIGDAEQASDVYNTIYMSLDSLQRAQLATRSRGKSPKFLIPFRMENREWRKQIIRVEHGIIEFLGAGQQFVAAGTHSSGTRYVWSADPALPTLSEDQVNAILNILTAKYATARTGSSEKLSTPSMSTSTEGTLCTLDEATWADLREALKFLVPHASNNDTWSEIGYALLSLKEIPGHPGATGREIFFDFSRQAPGYEAGEPENWWSAHAGQNPRTDFRHLFTLARAKGWRRASDPAVFESPPDGHVGDGAADPEGESVPVGGDTRVPEPAVDPRVIVVADSTLVPNLKELAEIMREDVYTQGTTLARLTQLNDDETIRRSSDQISLIQVSREWVRFRASQLATFVKVDGRNGNRSIVSCPGDLAFSWTTLNDWPGLRPLDAIARAPFMRADGSICDTAGYDGRGRAIYIPNAQYPPVPDAPTRDDAIDAAARLLGPFAEFPFTSKAARSAFLAHILTEAARVALDKVPMFWYTAPDAGTGKGLLVSMPAIIVHGTTPAMSPWVGDPDELRKSLFSSVLAGDRSVVFDNLPTGYKARSAELCAFLTSETWTDRKLGESSKKAVPNRAVMSATGNNINPVGDLSRRSVVIRLDANSARMRERVFKIADLQAHVHTHRATMLIDALTILKAHKLSGHKGPVTLPSFERWSRTVRDAVVWLDLTDPLDTQREETDDESSAVENIFAALVLHFSGNEFSAVDVARAVGGFTDQDGQLSHMMMANGCKDPTSPQNVGYWLRGMRDRIGGNVKLVPAGKNQLGVVWKFKQLGEDLA